MNTFDRVCSPPEDDLKAQSARQLLELILVRIPGEKDSRLMETLDQINAGTLDCDTDRLIAFLEEMKDRFGSLKSQYHKDLIKAVCTLGFWKTRFLQRCISITTNTPEKLMELHIETRVAILFSEPADRVAFYEYMTQAAPGLAFWRKSGIEEDQRLAKIGGAFNGWLSDRVQWGETCYDLDQLLRKRDLRAMIADFETYLEMCFSSGEGQLTVEY